jgi:hypothetical protein
MKILKTYKRKKIYKIKIISCSIKCPNIENYILVISSLIPTLLENYYG